MESSDYKFVIGLTDNFIPEWIIKDCDMPIPNLVHI